MYQPVLEDLTKLLVALLIGAIIGAEREYRTKSAGFRTVILITVGSTLFTIVSNLMSNDARVASNIVTGIGFLGAGAIFKEGANVKGLTLQLQFGFLQQLEWQLELDNTVSLFLLFL